MKTLEFTINTMNNIYHYPVMYKEVLDLLDLKAKKVIVDCTVGIGSHALKFFQAMNKDAYLVGIDRDEDSLKIASRRLKDFEGRFTLVKGDFSNIDNILKNLKIEKVDAFLFDLGISTHQLNDSERGFSFLKEGPLDMRMDKSSFLSACDLINNLSEVELENIFRKFGEERYSRRIAYAITEKRRKEPILTTTALAQIVLHSVPALSFKYRIHPATRIFQALRIAVNRELEVLKIGIEKAVSLLDNDGRIAIISFHSLEDRIAKHTFKDFHAKNILKLVTKKPLIPTMQEVEENPASRSAKLRVAERFRYL